MSLSIDANRPLEFLGNWKLVRLLAEGVIGKPTLQQINLFAGAPPLSTKPSPLNPPR